MRVIGITGGVGAGKTEVLNVIRDNCKCYIILADEVAHEIEKRGNECYDKLVKLLSEDILGDDLEIDKKKMSQKIFEGNEGLLLKVNQIVHPLVKKYILQKIAEQKENGECEYFFIEAALLIEDGYDKICDELWYVYAREEIRRERLKLMRGYTDEKITSIMNNQNSDEVFRNYCSFVIDNSYDIDKMKENLLNKISEMDRRK